jgi:hypothetical protein
VYRAFTHLGRGADLSATVIAPVGPMPEHRAVMFWKSFYTSLQEKLSVEEAVLASRRGAPVPIALFLRHRLGVEFLRSPSLEVDTTRGPGPTEARAALEASRELLDQLLRVAERYKGLPGDLTSDPRIQEAIEKERARQKDLEAYLDEFRRIDDVPAVEGRHDR